MDSNRPFYIHTVRDIWGTPGNQAQDFRGRWVRAVCVPYMGKRLMAAWWVLTGRAYAVLWPEPGELETIIDTPEPKPNPQEDRHE